MLRLKAQLKQVDIYPTGHSGDFTGKDLTVLRKWFFDRSVQNDEVNFQWPLIHTAHQLAPEKLDGYLGQGHYRELVEYLADEMNLFKDPKNDNRLEPQDRDARVEIVESLLHGMSQSIRYTRLDDPAKGYQIKSAVDIVKQNAGTISLKLEDVYKILVVRKDKDTGKESITPLDKEMLKRTYATKDGEPLGERGTVDLMDILARAEEIEKEKASNETGAANAIKTIVEEGPKPRGGREKK